MRRLCASSSLKNTILLFLFLCTYKLHTQTTPNYQLLTTADGLSQGMVFDILQSRNGFIWIATNDGLNRYDGTRFEVFSPDPYNPFAIGGSEITSLFEDHRGLIWISTPGQLEVFDPNSGRFFHVIHEGKPVSSQVYAYFTETPDGTVWLTDEFHIWKIGLPEGLLEKAVTTGDATIILPCRHIALQRADGGSEPRLQAASMFHAKNQKLLIGTNHGLFRFDPATEKVFPVYVMPDFEVRSIAENKVGEILIIGKLPSDLLDWVWISDSGVRDYRDHFNPVFPRSVFTFDSAGYLWTFRDKSIQKWQVSALFNRGNPELEIKTDAFLLKGEYAYCTKLLFDQSGVCWIGTNGFGIIKLNDKAAKFKTCLPDISQRIVVEAPNGGLYGIESPQIKYRSKTFDHQAPNVDFFGNFHPFDNNSVGRLAVCFDAAGNGWSLSHADSLLYRMDAVTKSLQTFPWRGVGLLCDRSGALLSTGKTGLRKFDPRTKTSSEYLFDTPQKKATDYSHYLYEDVNGVVWLFGFEGLTKATPDKSGYRFEYFRNNPANQSSLSNNIVLSVADDPLEPRQYLWVGTKTGGLNRLDKQSGQWKHYKKEQGLPDNVVYGILAENVKPGTESGFIWLSTNKGLCRFDVRAETTKNFTVADGLQDNEFNSSSYLKMRDGTMIFGGVKGLTVFHPDSLRFNEQVPLTHIVGLQVNNQPFDISGKSSISLSYNQNLLNFDFAALEFTNPAQNQYRYQLMGVDKDWVSLGNKNSIQFANLAPGTYTFKVLGSNNDGFWSEQPAELRFTIRPPWWASWWAYLLYLALAVAGIWWYYQHLLRQRFSEQEKLRLQELDDFKSRFFTNITHEFRTPLTVILGMSERVLSEGVTSSHPLTIAQPVSLIKRSGENLLRLVNQILDLSKLETNALKMNYIQGDILTFIRYIAESLHSLANAQNLMLRVESDQAKIVMDYDPERFLQIIHNLLSNAIKFTPSGGKVVLRANLEGQYFHISVTDSGAGIPPDELPHVFDRFFQARNQEHAKAGGTGIGLSLTRELVKAMGGEISVESTVGVGSTFMVKLPITNSSAFEEKPVLIDRVTSSHPVNSTPLSEGLTSSQTLTRQTVLLIEDNPDVVEYLNVCLKDQYSLDFAYNGQAGIDKALETIPDLIISDVMMSFKDGFEVVETLKNDERTSHIPIILLTAKADVQSRLTGLRRGADAYLAKPFHQEELLVTLENLLESRRKLQLKYQQQILATETNAAPAAAVEVEDAFLQKVRVVIEAHYSEEDFGLPQLCQKIGMSRSQLFRKMKALTDIAPSDLIRSHRLNKARTLLESGAANVAEAAWQVGFKDPSYFTKLYQEEFGVAPSTTRK
ncbi:MAG: ATP-binding protein [Saprospiraceae bacterium]